MNVLIATVVTFVMSVGLAILLPLLPVSVAVLSVTGAFVTWLLPTVYTGHM